MIQFVKHVGSLGAKMEKDTRWEPYTGLGVHEQISKLLDDFVRSEGENSPLFTWVPVLDSPKLRPN
jgi:hypothetical protein